MLLWLNPTLPATDRKASQSILRILRIQWCALSPFICAIFRGSNEGSDERGATKAFPSKEAKQRQHRHFFQLFLFFLPFFFGFCFPSLSVSVGAWGKIHLLTPKATFSKVSFE